ncbi:MAG: hypothetical protein ACR2MG_09570 [Pyrinomonadaceae bacterium]
MITGFNTDIDYQGVTYHVQTEDKGVDTPLILSLVYDRGTILASKRSPYDDLLADTFDEKALTERLQKQHKLMCAAVRAGRIEDLKRMTMKDSASRQKGLVAQKEVKIVVEEKEIKPPPTEIRPKKTEEIPLPPLVLKEKPQSVKQSGEITLDLAKAKPKEKVEVEIPKPKDELVWDIPISVVDEMIIEAVQIVEEEMILPAEAVEIISDSAKTEQIIDDTLKVELLNDINFKGGERKTVSILVFRGNQETGLSGAQIIVKVIGTSFRPLIFHAKTDSNGVAIVHLQLPHFKTGRAAVLVRAMSEGEETELRRVIKQG